MPTARSSRLALVAAGLAAVAATACVRDHPVALAPSRVLDTLADDPADDRPPPPRATTSSSDAAAAPSNASAPEYIPRRAPISIGAVLPDTVDHGPAVNGNLPAWDEYFLYVADAQTRRVTAVVTRPFGSDITAVAVDPTGMQLAALARSGHALHWRDLAAAPRDLRPNILPAPDPVPEPIDATRDAELKRHVGRDYQLLAEPYRPNPWRRFANLDAPDDDAWALALAAKRLAFSPDSARLVAGMHLYALADGRDLLPLRADEIALDLTRDAAIVARFTIDHFTIGTTACWCGTCRASAGQFLRLTALEYRAVGAAPIPFPPGVGLPRGAAVERREVELELLFLRLPPFTTTWRRTTPAVTR